MFSHKSSMTAEEDKNLFRRNSIRKYFYFSLPAWACSELSKGCCLLYTVLHQYSLNTQSTEGCFDLRLEVPTCSPPFIIVTIRHCGTLCHRKHDVFKLTPVIFWKHLLYLLYFRIDLEIFSILNTICKIFCYILGAIKIVTNLVKDLNMYRGSRLEENYPASL